MLHKTKIALTAVTVLFSASAAFAYESPENKIGDSYPFLEQAYQANSSKRVKSAKMTAPRITLPSWNLSSSEFSNPHQYDNDAIENKIGDRYPLLEPKTQSPRARAQMAHMRHHKKKA